MPRLPAKRPPKSLETRRRKATENLAFYPVAPVQAIAISAKYHGERVRAWRLWNDYARNVLQLEDPDSVWIDLCKGTPAAEHMCKAFLEDYIDSSTKFLPVVGSDEAKEVQTVKSVRTVIALWERLVVEADARADKRRNTGPVAQIIQWISLTVKVQHDLTSEQQFVKVEATGVDVIVILDIFWRRAADIYCSPRDRNAFHSAILCLGFGFRPGVILPMRYCQVQLGLMLDENSPCGRTLIASITVSQNKQETGKVYDAQDHILTFHIKLIPDQRLCLVTHLVTTALFDNAFEETFESLDQLLRRPNMEGGVYLPLKWKDDMLAKNFIDLDYPRYWELWTRVWFVAGIRHHVKPYALRVAAGAEFDGVLTPAVRNYVLSHKSMTFSKSYQPRAISKSLMPLKFGPSAGQVDDVVIANLRNSTLQRDERAPLYPTAEDLADIDERTDVRQLSEDLKEAKKERNQESTHVTRTAVSRLSAALYDLKDTLYKQAVIRNRLEYFDKVDTRRAQGAPIDDLVDLSTNPHTSRFRRSFPAAVYIGQFLSDKELGREQRPQTHSALLLSFLRGQFPTVEQEVAALFPEIPSVPAVSLASSTCLLCDLSFSQRGNLSRHHHKKHLTSSFNEPFPCPQCAKGNQHHLVTGAAEWSNHVERAHGKAHAPILQQPTLVNAKLLQRRSDVRCLFCGHNFPAGNAFSRHTNSCHMGLFDAPFDCPECRRENRNERIDTLSTWLKHTSEIHGSDGQTGALIRVEEIKPQKRAKKMSNGAGWRERA